MSGPGMLDEVRRIVASVLRVEKASEIGDDDDLARWGLDSVSAVGVLLELERRLGLASLEGFDDPRAFESVKALTEMVARVPSPRSSP